MRSVCERGATLEYLTLYPDDFTAGQSYPLIFCLHGFGASKDDLSDLPPLIDAKNYLYVLPDGPLAAADEPSMRGWYERGGNESPAAVREAIAALDGCVTEVLARFQPPQTVLLGFSQGGALALRYGLPRPNVFAGIAVLSGSLRLVETLDLPADRQQPIFVAHGQRDTMIPVEWSQDVVAFLQGQGYQPHYKTYPIGHEISPGLVTELRGWIKQVLR